MNQDFDTGDAVYTPLGRGTVLGKRNAPPDFSSTAAYSVALDARKGDPRYAGTCFDVADVSPLRHIGDVAVCRGEPPEGNPYKGSLIGEERATALRAFKARGEAPGYTLWLAPSSGRCRRIDVAEVNWEGVRS